MFFASKKVLENNELVEEKQTVNIDETSTKKEEITIIPGENPFDTRFQTWIHYIRQYYDEYLVNGTVSFKAVKEIKAFLSWRSININTANFCFVEAFTETLIDLSSLLFIDHCCENIRYSYNEDTKSTKLTIDSYYNVEFDFYEIPGKINSALDSLDIETSNLLEQYINDGTIQANNKYVNILFKRNDAEKFTEITFKNDKNSNIKDSEFSFVLEKIMIFTYHYLKATYHDILKYIILDYYDVCEKKLYDWGFGGDICD